MKTAFVTGVGGQSGSYLSRLLLEKDYKIYGLKRRTVGNGLENVKDILDKIEIIEGDMIDPTSLARAVQLTKPDLVFNLAAQSFVSESFKSPVATAQITGMGVLHLLEAIRIHSPNSRMLQASTSEMWGGAPPPQNETTPFYPKSPYAIAKVFGFQMTVNYRESYKLFACNSICTNHTSPFRGPEFVTRKVSKAVARIKLGKQDKLYLGNLEAKRDWSFAGDMVDGMYRIITYKEPQDFVLASGETYSIRELCQIAFDVVGLDYKDYVVVDEKLKRPAEVNVLLGDSTKARTLLGWEPKIKFPDLIKMMVEADLEREK